MSRSPNDLTTLSLFTGADGLDLRLAAAGFEPVHFVKVDSESRETLKQNRPEWRCPTPATSTRRSPIKC